MVGPGQEVFQSHGSGRIKKFSNLTVWSGRVTGYSKFHGSVPVMTRDVRVTRVSSHHGRRDFFGCPAGRRADLASDALFNNLTAAYRSVTIVTRGLCPLVRKKNASRFLPECLSDRYSEIRARTYHDASHRLYQALAIQLHEANQATHACSGCDNKHNNSSYMT